MNFNAALKAVAAPINPIMTQTSSMVRSWAKRSVKFAVLRLLPKNFTISERKKRNTAGLAPFLKLFHYQL